MLHDYDDRGSVLRGEKEIGKEKIEERKTKKLDISNVNKMAE